MTHTNEFLRGMFAAYMGCEVINTDEGNHFKMIGISGYFISVYEPPYPFCESEGDEYEWMFSECKPILTPLSEITDEDAIEVAKIMLSKDNNWKPVRIERNECYVEIVTKEEIDETDVDTTITMLIRFWIYNNRIAWIWNYKKGNNTGVDDRRVPNMQYVIDYLRSPFRPDGTPKPVYDCGYMHIPSLITAGLAIKKTT